MQPSPGSVGVGVGVDGSGGSGSGTIAGGAHRPTENARNLEEWSRPGAASSRTVGGWRSGKGADSPDDGVRDTGVIQVMSRPKVSLVPDYAVRDYDDDSDLEEEMGEGGGRGGGGGEHRDDKGVIALNAIDKDDGARGGREGRGGTAAAAAAAAAAVAEKQRTAVDGRESASFARGVTPPRMNDGSGRIVGLSSGGGSGGGGGGDEIDAAIVKDDSNAPRAAAGEIAPQGKASSNQIDGATTAAAAVAVASNGAKPILPEKQEGGWAFATSALSSPENAPVAGKGASRVREGSFRHGPAFSSDEEEEEEEAGHGNNYLRSGVTSAATGKDNANTATATTTAATAAAAAAAVAVAAAATADTDEDHDDHLGSGGGGTGGDEFYPGGGGGGYASSSQASPTPVRMEASLPGLASVVTAERAEPATAAVTVSRPGSHLAPTTTAFRKVASFSSSDASSGGEDLGRAATRQPGGMVEDESRGGGGGASTTAAALASATAAVATTAATAAFADNALKFGVDSRARRGGEAEEEECGRGGSGNGHAGVVEGLQAGVEASIVRNFDDWDDEDYFDG